MQETYRGHHITITPMPIPSRTIGRGGPPGKGWMVAINGQDVTKEILRSGVDGPESVLGAAKAYVDKIMS